MEIRALFPKIIVPNVSEKVSTGTQTYATYHVPSDVFNHQNLTQSQSKPQTIAHSQGHAIMTRRYGMSRLRVLFGAMRDRGDLSLDDEAKIAEEKLTELLKIKGVAGCKEFLDERYPDPSKQYVVLSELEFLAKDKADDFNFKDTLQVLMEGLYEEKSVELKAGLNTAETFDQVFKDQKDSQLSRNLLREFYRSFLVAEVRPSAFLQKLLEKYSCEEIEDILKALLSGASEDLNSPLCSSTNRVYFCLNNISTGNLILQVLKKFKLKIYRIWQFNEALSNDEEIMDGFDVTKINCKSETFPFKKGWQFLAVDFLNMTGLLSSNELVKHIFITKHLKNEHYEPKLSRVGVRYLSLIKDSFLELPAHVFVSEAVPGGANASAEPERKTLINKFYWVDSIQEAYGARRTQSDWMRC